MCQRLKARIKWGTVILAAMAVSIFTANDQCDLTQTSSHGLTKKLLSKAEALASPFLYFLTDAQDSSKETSSQTQNSKRKATSEK